MVSKGQAAVEFIAVFGFLLVIFVILQIAFLNSRSAAEEERAGLFAQKVVRELASKINLVAESPGLSTQYEVTPLLGEYSLAYTVTVTNSTVSISFNYGGTRKSAASPVRLRRADNGSGSQAFNLTSGIYEINNTNGVVFVARKA